MYTQIWTVLNWIKNGFAFLLRNRKTCYTRTHIRTTYITGIGWCRGAISLILPFRLGRAHIAQWTGMNPLANHLAKNWQWTDQAQPKTKEKKSTRSNKKCYCWSVWKERSHGSMCNRKKKMSCMINCNTWPHNHPERPGTDTHREYLMHFHSHSYMWRPCRTYRWTAHMHFFISRMAKVHNAIALSVMCVYSVIAFKGLSANWMLWCEWEM